MDRRLLGKLIVSLGLLLLLMNGGPINASEKLDREQIGSLLAGNTVEAYYMREGEQQGLIGRVRLTYRFFRDGGDCAAVGRDCAPYGLNAGDFRRWRWSGPEKDHKKCQDHDAPDSTGSDDRRAWPPYRVGFPGSPRSILDVRVLQ